MTDRERLLGVTFPPTETRYDVSSERRLNRRHSVMTPFSSPKAGVWTPCVLAEMAIKTDRIVLGTGLAPASVRLSGEVADGWMPFFVPASRAGDLLALVEEGTTRRTYEGRCRFCPVIGTAVAGDERAAREQAAWWVGFYLTSMGPLYPRTLQRLGFDAEVTAVRAANQSRSPFVVPREAEVLLDELVVCGTPDAARTRLDRWYDAGAELAIVSLPPTGSSAAVAVTPVAPALSALDAVANGTPVMSAARAGTTHHLPNDSL